MYITLDRMVIAGFSCHVTVRCLNYNVLLQLVDVHIASVNLVSVAVHSFVGRNHLGLRIPYGSWASHHWLSNIFQRLTL